jgi:hypothetical protein
VEKKPYQDPKTFEKVFLREKSWQRMADYFTSKGHAVSETSIRRLAAKFDLSLTDLHREDAPKAHRGLNKAEAKEAAARQKLAEAKKLAAEADKQVRETKRLADKHVKDTVRELEKQFAKRVDEASRAATPKELAQAEQRILKAEQKANKYRQIAGELARDTNIIEEVGELLRPLIDGFSFPEVETPTHLEGSTDDPFSLLLSINDVHFGDLVDPKRINGMNAYSPNIAARRIEHVIDMTKVWAHNYRQIGDVDELVVLLNGDNFSGMHQIHPDEAVEYAKIGKQAMDCALLIAQAVWELSHFFPRIRVIAPAGDNHTRSTRRNATSSVAVETSWSSLHHEMIASLLVGVPHLEFNIAASYQVFFDVKGHTWAAAHGHMLKGGGGQLGIPAYALKRLHDATVSKGVIMAKNLDMSQFETAEAAASVISGIAKHTIIGHFHQQFYAQFNGGDVRIAPSLKGSDSFSNDVLAKYAPAAQSLFAIHPEHDVVGDHTINVQHISAEGDTRYKWGALEGDKTAAEIMREWMETANATI